MTAAFFLSDGPGRFISTTWTRGPWDPNAQHGGPPAALLGRAIEEVIPEGSSLGVARITFDLLRPVPVTALTVETNLVRPGKKVALVEALLRDGADTVMRASAWLIRKAELDRDVRSQEDGPIPPSQAEPGETLETAWADESYLAGMEWRFAKGAFLEPGPATAWLRMRIPLVDDEQPSPLVRVLTAVDSGSGISNELHFHEWLFVNPELTVHLFRFPVGEWVCLDSTTTIADGVGLAATHLYDERGSIGRAGQSLYVASRAGGD